MRPLANAPSGVYLLLSSQDRPSVWPIHQCPSVQRLPLSARRLGKHAHLTMQAAAATGTDPFPATTEQAPARHWSLVDSSGICPTARSGHSAVVAKNSLYIFGGCGHPAVKRPDAAEAVSASSSSDDLAEAMPVCLGDLNVYDLARQRWSEVLPASTACPAERTCAAMCASEEEDRLFLSGGAGDDPYDLRADLLEFDVRRRSWRVLYDGGAQVDDVDSAGSEGGGGGVAAGASACRRIGHAMVHDAGRNRLVVFGGSTGEFLFFFTKK